MMNVSNTPTQRAESQPETDSKPPDPAQRSDRYLSAVAFWQLEQAHLHRSWANKLSENKIETSIFIQPGIALDNQDVALTEMACLGGMLRQCIAEPGSGR